MLQPKPIVITLAPKPCRCRNCSRFIPHGFKAVKKQNGYCCLYTCMTRTPRGTSLNKQAPPMREEQQEAI